MIDQTATVSPMWRKGSTSMNTLTEEHLNLMFPIKPSKFMLNQQAIIFKQDQETGKYELPDSFSWLD